MDFWEFMCQPITIEIDDEAGSFSMELPTKITPLKIERKIPKQLIRDAEWKLLK